MKVNKSVPQSLNLIVKILSTFVTSRKKKAAASAIEAIDAKQSLLSVFIRNLSLYQSERNGEEGNAKYSHKDQIGKFWRENIMIHIFSRYSIKFLGIFINQFIIEFINGSS